MYVFCLYVILKGKQLPTVSLVNPLQGYRNVGIILRKASVKRPTYISDVFDVLQLYGF